VRHRPFYFWQAQPPIGGQAFVEEFLMSLTLLYPNIPPLNNQWKESAFSPSITFYLLQSYIVCLCHQMLRAVVLSQSALHSVIT